VVAALVHAQQQAVAHREQQGYGQGGGDQPARHKQPAPLQRLGAEQEQQQQADVQRRKADRQTKS